MTLFVRLTIVVGTPSLTFSGKLLGLSGVVGDIRQCVQGLFVQGMASSMKRCEFADASSCVISEKQNSQNGLKALQQQ
jgi:hypothetical protein